MTWRGCACVPSPLMIRRVEVGGAGHLLPAPEILTFDKLNRINSKRGLLIHPAMWIIHCGSRYLTSSHFGKHALSCSCLGRDSFLSPTCPSMWGTKLLATPSSRIPEPRSESDAYLEYSSQSICVATYMTWGSLLKSGYFPVTRGTCSPESWLHQDGKGTPVATKCCCWFYFGLPGGSPLNWPSILHLQTGFLCQGHFLAGLLWKDVPIPFWGKR